MSVKPEKRYTDAQLQARLSKLEPDQQHCFFRYADPLLNEESDMYLSVISKCRMSFADAIAKLKDTEPTDEEEEASAEQQEVDNAATPFDTSTQIGKQMAMIGLAFSELLAVHEPGTDISEGRLRSADSIQRRNRLKSIAGEETEEESEKKRKKEKKSKKSKRKHETEGGLSSDPQAALLDELSAAAQEEQKLIMDKMLKHGSKMKEERKRQKEKIAEKLNEAQNQKRGQADAVDMLFDKKQELDDLHQQDKSRQEQAVKERLEKRRPKKEGEKDSSLNDLGELEETIEVIQTTDGVPIQKEVDEIDGTETKERKKHRKKRQKQADDFEENTDPQE